MNRQLRKRIEQFGQGGGTIEDAVIAYQSGKTAAAKSCCERLLQRDPAHSMARQLIGILAFESGAYDTAIDHFKSVTMHHPQEADGYNNLGRVLSQTGRTQEAIDALERAVALNPLLGDAFCNLAGALSAEGHFSRAIEANLQANRILPSSVHPVINLAALFAECGRISEALEMYGVARRLDSTNQVAASNRLMTIQYSEEYSSAELFSQAVEWGNSQPQPSYRFSSSRRSGPLRIGYVSGDFCEHPLGYVMERILVGHDRSRFEIFCYANQVRVDELTARAQAASDHWHFVGGLDDQKLADLIFSHEIDVLVDLSGHTALNRLGVFARKPAPVQATWLGYFATTGLSQIDYVLRDPIQIPVEESRFYAERRFEIPADFGFSPAEDCPEVSPVPALTEDRLTFACFNNLSKVNDRVLDAWAAILKRVPYSRLLVVRRPFADLQIADRIRSEFVRRGIDESRIDLRASRGHLNYLRLYGEADIVLDTFPFNGGTTTYEAIWMGVPVVARSWDRMVGHFAESILKPCELDEFVAESDEEYIEIAVKLALDLDRLTELRGELRGRMERSGLCNAADCTRNLESAFEAMSQAHYSNLRRTA